MRFQQWRPTEEQKERRRRIRAERARLRKAAQRKYSREIQTAFEAGLEQRAPIVTVQTVWERGDYCQLCGQRIDDNKPCGCGARRET